MYKKSYTGFVLSLIAYLGMLLAISFLPTEDFNLPLRLITLLTIWYMAALTFYIWRTERVYLYTGTAFEDAEAAGSERRKDFAWRHFRIFGMLALVTTVLSCVTYLLGRSAWIDFTVGMVGLVAACCMTIPIKL